jgi:hypothetical protein
MSRCAALRALAFAILLALSAAPAAAGNLFELNFYLFGPRYDGKLPPCEARSALDRISSRFGQKEGVFWETNLTIEAFEHMRETAYRPWAPNTLPRRFCTAVAQLSDGSRQPIYYSIAEDSGMIGMTIGVEWCMPGLDRNWAYSPRCKMAQP